METKDKLIEKLKESGNLLSSAECPDCDGSGILTKESKQSQCFWCYHKDKLLLEIAVIPKQESKPISTAEEIIDRYLSNYGWQYWAKINVIKAMEEYANQSKTK